MMVMAAMVNRLRLAWQVLLRGATLQVVTGGARRREVPAITAEEVAEARLFFPQEKFFIFGHARSGTTLLTRLVRVHPRVHCNYQAHFFTRQPLLESLVADEEIGRWLSRNSNRWNQGRDLSPLVLRAASDFIMERDARRAGKAGSDCVVGDKSPNSLLDGLAVQQLVKVYPDGRLIFIVRDGRDAALSHRFQAFIDRPQHLNDRDVEIRQAFISDPAPFLAGKLSLFTEKGLHQAAEGWVHNVTETDTIARQMLGERYFSLRYEDLLASPWEKMIELWRFLGVSPHPQPLSRGERGEGPHPQAILQEERGGEAHTPPLYTGAEEGYELWQALQSELSQNPDADWQQQKAGEIAAALQKGKRGTWRELFTEHDRRIFLQVAGDTLAAWNYPLE